MMKHDNFKRMFLFFWHVFAKWGDAQALFLVIRRIPHSEIIHVSVGSFYGGKFSRYGRYCFNLAVNSEIDVKKSLLRRSSVLSLHRNFATQVQSGCEWMKKSLFNTKRCIYLYEIVNDKKKWISAKTSCDSFIVAFTF